MQSWPRERPECRLESLILIRASGRIFPTAPKSRQPCRCHQMSWWSRRLLTCETLEHDLHRYVSNRFVWESFPASAELIKLTFNSPPHLFSTIKKKTKQKPHKPVLVSVDRHVYDVFVLQTLAARTKPLGGDVQDSTSGWGLWESRS